MLLASSPWGQGTLSFTLGGPHHQTTLCISEIPGARSALDSQPGWPPLTHSPFSAAIRWMFDFIQVKAAKSQCVFPGFNHLGHGQ